VNIKTNENGFTLVELAMVLLIISLILGGVLKGAEMVENAEVDRLINDMQGFQTSYYAYYDRKGFYPGGSGSQLAYDSAQDLTDSGLFFSDLFEEGFIKDSRPVAKLVTPGLYFVNYLGSGDSISISTGAILGKNQICVTLLEKKHAIHIDNRIDDGLWNAGQMRSANEYNTQDRHTVCLEI